MDRKQFAKDLEKRTRRFAVNIIRLSVTLPDTPEGRVVRTQITKAGTSVGANYRESNEALSKKDFIHRMRITRKECKESTYWLKLLKEPNPDFVEKIDTFILESRELRNIFSSILAKAVPEKKQ